MAALIGLTLAPTDAFITLPLVLQFVGLMTVTIPASLIMNKLGRRKGFYLGNSFGIIGAVSCLITLMSNNFLGFCGGSFLLGIGLGFGTLYRFAAAEFCTA